MSPFWQMFWADALWSLVWLFGISVPGILAYGFWKKRKAKSALGGRKEPGRRMVFLEAPVEAGRCPLCARPWPLEGPLVPEKKEDRSA